MSEPSFKGVNYSLRPSKTIQRGLVFEGLRALRDDLDWSKASYVGMGSIWFTDFVLAHRALGLNRMVSIESHSIGYQRAVFNKPYRFIRMKEGFTFDVVPTLYEDEVRFPNNPAIMWLDYDSALDDDKLDELRYVVEKATADSVLLVTFDASDRHYGVLDERGANLRDLFGNLAPQRFKASELAGLKLGITLADLVEKLLRSASLKARKVNPGIPAFKIVYQDGATMVTVGVVFPRQEKRDRVARRVASVNWPGRPDAPVIAPHLTMKEASALQANLPVRAPMTRRDVRRLGFDLEDEQIEAFAKFYRHYPTFAQVFS